MYSLFQLKGLEAQNDKVTISAQCQRDINLFNLGVVQRQPWALRMLDAKGKLGSGLLGGNGQLVGMFEQCRRVKATNSSIIGQSQHDFDAQYCRIYWPVSEDAYVVVSLGDCLPATCSEEDVSTLYTTLNGSNVAVDNVYCFQYEETFWNDPASISAFVFLLLFVLLVGCATLYDYMKTTVNSKDQGQTELKKIPLAIYPAEDTTTTVQNGNVNAALEAEPTENNSSTTNTLPTSLNGNVTTALATESTGKKSSTLPPTPHAAVSVPIEDEKILRLQGDVEPEVKDVSSFSNKQSETDHPGCGENTLSCFSLIRNLPNILSTESGSRSYLCMNGIRFFSMTWIVLGHAWQLGTYTWTNGKQNIMENVFSYFFTTGDKWLHHAVIFSMYLGVDTFFVLSGCLVTVSFLKSLKRQNGRVTVKSMGLHYFHRYWRLTPLYAAILFMGASFFPYLGEGPTPREVMEHQACTAVWWMNLLYINTLGFSDRPLCLVHTWYLSDDFQYYIIAPVFIFMLYRWPIFGGIFLGLGWIGTTVARIVLVVTGPLTFGNFYIPPWTRFGPYAIGIALGYLIYRTQCKVKLHWIVVTTGWLIAGVLSWIALLGKFHMDQRDLSKAARDMYEIFNHDMFAVAVAWMIFACCAGYGGLLNSFMSWKAFVPLSRLTYCGYLIHPLIMYYQANFRQRPIYVDGPTMTFLFLGYLSMTLLVSVPLILLFEVPFLELEKIMFSKKRK